MMRYQDWRLIQEAVHGASRPLGVSRVPKVGGVMGSRLHDVDDEEGKKGVGKWDDLDDELEDDEDVKMRDDEDMEDDDLDVDDEDDLDMDDDDMGDDDFDEDELEDDEDMEDDEDDEDEMDLDDDEDIQDVTLDFEDSQKKHDSLDLDKMRRKAMRYMDDDDDDDTDFDYDDDMHHEDDMDDDEVDMDDNEDMEDDEMLRLSGLSDEEDKPVPCPKCNEKGLHPVGSKDCEECKGAGYVSKSYHEWAMNEMNNNDWAVLGQTLANLAKSAANPQVKKAVNDMMRVYQTAQQQLAQPGMQQNMQQTGQANVGNVQQGMGVNQMRRYMSKGSSRYCHKCGCEDCRCDHCRCGDKEWEDSLREMMHHDAIYKVNKRKKKKRLKKKLKEAEFREDLLIPVGNDGFQSNEPKPGEVGFAPVGRIGGVVGAGNYTQEDIQDIPVMDFRYST